MTIVALLLSLFACAVAGTAYRRGKRNTRRYLNLLIKFVSLKRILMARLDEVAASNAALAQAVVDLSARIDALPKPAASEADLDVVKQGIDASTAAVNALVPPTA